MIIASSGTHHPQGKPILAAHSSTDTNSIFFRCIVLAAIALMVVSIYLLLMLPLAIAANDFFSRCVDTEYHCLVRRFRHCMDVTDYTRQECILLTSDTK